MMCAPADFPALKRVTIDMPSGIVSKLRLAAYLALTSNSVQFGATLDVFIGVSGCGLAGHLGFDALLHAYESGLKIALRHSLTTLFVMIGTIVVTGYLYVIIPKGFFPQQDTGLIIAQSEAAQDISFQAMAERQQALLNAIMRDQKPWQSA